MLFRSNDDLVMSLAIGCWVRDTAVINNERNLEYSKAFLSAITKAGNYLDTSVRKYQNEDRARKQQQMQNVYSTFDWIIKG